MLDLTGELELGLMEENEFWNTSKSSLIEEKLKKKKKIEEGKVKFKVKRHK